MEVEFIYLHTRIFKKCMKVLNSDILLVSLFKSCKCCFGGLFVMYVSRLGLLPFDWIIYFTFVLMLFGLLFLFQKEENPKILVCNQMIYCFEK